MATFSFTTDEVRTDTTRKVRLVINFKDPLLNKDVTFRKKYTLRNATFPPDLGGDMYDFLYQFYAKHIGNGWNSVTTADQYNELRPKYLKGADADAKAALAARRRAIIKAGIAKLVERAQKAE